MSTKRIGVIKGWAHTEIYERRYPEFTLVEQENVREALNAVSAGTIDIVSVTLPIANYLITKHFISGLEVLGKELLSEVKENLQLRVGVRNDWPQLIAILEKGMAAISDNELNALSNKWQKQYGTGVQIDLTDEERKWLTENSVITVAADPTISPIEVIEKNNEISGISGEYLKLIEKKLGVQFKWAGNQNWVEESYETIIRIVSIAGLVVVAILIWSFSMRREINRRKAIEQKLIVSQAAAEKANLAKSTFLANMSHEIRTPLNAIIGFSEVMISGIYGKIEQEKYIEYLGDISSSGKHLADVINDILDLSKIEAGKWQLKEDEFDLYRCFNSASKMIEVTARDKGIILDVENKITHEENIIIGDEQAFKRIFINLFSNAVKFTLKGGSIKSRVSYLSNGSFEIVISDTGIGIPENKLEHVLIPFGQIEDDHELNEEGTGLGLAIVNQLVELHGGKFHLESIVGKGTSAIISLPNEKLVSRSS